MEGNERKDIILLKIAIPCFIISLIIFPFLSAENDLVLFLVIPPWAICFMCIGLYSARNPETVFDWLSKWIPAGWPRINGKFGVLYFRHLGWAFVVVSALTLLIVIIMILMAIFRPDLLV